MKLIKTRRAALPVSSAPLSVFVVQEAYARGPHVAISTVVPSDRRGVAASLHVVAEQPLAPFASAS